MSASGALRDFLGRPLPRLGPWGVGVTRLVVPGVVDLERVGRAVESVDRVTRRLDSLLERLLGVAEVAWGVVSSTRRHLAEVDRLDRRGVTVFVRDLVERAAPLGGGSRDLLMRGMVLNSTVSHSLRVHKNTVVQPTMKR